MFKNEYSKKNILIILLFFIIPIFFFWKVISSETMLYSGDGVGYLAAKELIKRSLLNGEFPLWNKFNAIGVPFAADIQNAVFYPLNILILIFPVNIGFELYFTLHLSLAAIGMYYYLLNLTKRTDISFAGGLVLMFSNILIIRFDHINIMANIAWLPFMMLMTDKLIENRKGKYAIFLGIIMATQFLAGFPQIALYSDIFIFCYYIIYNVHYKSNIKEIIKFIFIFISTYIGLIAIQILPLTQLILFSGREKISYDFFVSFSHSWKMLLQMIFPTFWGFASSNLNIGTEFPTDIYIGIIPLILCIYAVRYQFRDFRVKVFLWTMIITYLYACCGELPILGKILYRIPLINSFRVPSRIISLTVINGLMLTFYSLYLLLKDKDYKNYLKISITILIFSCCIVLLINFIGSPIFNVFKDEYKAYYYDFKIYRTSLFLMTLNIIVVYMLRLSKWPVLKCNLVSICCILIAIITIIDVYHLNRDFWSDNYRIQKLANNSTENQFNSEVGKFLDELKDKDKYRFIVDFNDMNEYYSLHSDIIGNNNIFHSLMSLQSYITFHNPNYNKFCNVDDSKYLTSRLLFSDTNESVISSLSTKYIVKRGADISLPYNNATEKAIIYADSTEVEMNSKIDSIVVHSAPIKLEKEFTYLIDLEIDMDGMPVSLCADFYGGEGSYDFSEQQISLLPNLTEGNNELSFLLKSGNFDIPVDACLRIMLSGNTNLVIKKLEVYKLNTKNIDYYNKIYFDGEYLVFENPNVKPIIYIPQHVKHTEDSMTAVINNMTTSDIANIIYAENSKNYNQSNINSSITDIGVAYNNISANITSEHDTFVVMTQSWYPGWKAYIDGQNVPIHLVNGVVQGIEVPSGNHSIKFQFVSSYVVLGAFISILTIIFIAIYICKNRKNIT